MKNDKIEVEIISGDIGSVRNILNKLMKESVKKVISISQSSINYTSIVITIIYQKI